ncbi:hypothetical protein Aperf_G00000115168 [Anoplocephala perfoliata]
MRCYYEILGVERTADPSKIKEAFRKASLIWHPDKNSAPEATAKFQELQEAYRVLSDVQERAWYDRHRDQILRGGQGGVGGNYTEERLDVFKYFSRSCFDGFDDGPKGFYTVYRKVFEDIADEERLASDSFNTSDSEDVSSFPTFGQLDSDYDSVVRPFYTYWEGFSTRKSYSWVEKYDTRRLSSRTERRLAEAENRRLRDAAKKERNEEIRALVAYVGHRDKRVAAERARFEAAAEEAYERNRVQATRIRQKNAAELEAEWAQEVASGGLSSQWETDFQKELDRLEAGLDGAASLYEETSSDEKNSEDSGHDDEEEVEEEVDDESCLLCVACDKVFASLGAKINHEASKKHKKQVELLRSILLQEEEGMRLTKESLEIQEVEISGNDDLRKKEVKLTKRAKKAKRRQQRDMKREEQEGILSGNPEHPPLKGDPVEPVSESDSDMGMSEVQKGKSSNQKKSRRRRQRAVDPEVLEHSEGGEHQVEKIGEGKVVDEEEIYIVESSSKAKAQKSRQSQDPSRIHTCLICNEVYPSKNKLFSHIKETGHAALKSGPAPASKKPNTNKKNRK